MSNVVPGTGQCQQCRRTTRVVQAKYALARSKVNYLVCLPCVERMLSSDGPIKGWVKESLYAAQARFVGTRSPFAEVNTSNRVSRRSQEASSAPKAGFR